MKSLSQDQINVLLEKGCKVWEGGQHRRIYINLAKIGILNLRYYNTGNIHHAEFLGGVISNSYAYKLVATKIYVDLIDNSLHILNCKDELKQDIEKAIDCIFD